MEERCAESNVTEADVGAAKILARRGDERRNEAPAEGGRTEGEPAPDSEKTAGDAAMATVPS